MAKSIVDRHEILDSELERDTRTGWQKFMDYVMYGQLHYLFAVTGVICAAVPLFAPILLPPALSFLIMRKLNPPSLAYYMPKTSGFKKDPRDISPETRKPGPPAGISYFGNVNYPKDPLLDKQQVWFTSGASRQHVLYLATTGGGKTVGLTSMVPANALIQGSGFIMIDGKADPELYANTLALAHRVGRTDDVYVISYLTGNQDIWVKEDRLLTNRFNPFYTGSTSLLTELLVSLLDAEGDIWGKKANSFLGAWLRPLVYLRDHGKLNITITTLTRFLTLEELGKLVARKDVPEGVMAGLRTYVENIPGMNTKTMQALLTGNQFNNQTVVDQHGYIAFQIEPVLNMLGGQYGHVFDTLIGDVDFRDIVLNRRILLVLLPALEKADQSLANLGRIVLASIRSMMGGTLTPDLEGDLHDRLNKRQTKAPTPFPCVFDEIGYYFVAGTGVAAAQARGLGFMLVFAAQDLPAMKRLGETAAKETQSVIGNTNIKLIGRLEETEETFKALKERGGMQTVSVSAGLQRQDSSTGAPSYVEGSVNYEKRDRLDLRKLSKLKEGELYIAHEDTLLPCRSWFAQAPPVKRTYLNKVMAIRAPSQADLAKVTTATRDLTKTFISIIKTPSAAPSHDDLDGSLELLAKAANSDFFRQSPISGAAAAFLQKQKEIEDHFSLDAALAEHEFTDDDESEDTSFASSQEGYLDLDDSAIDDLPGNTGSADAADEDLVLEVPSTKPSAKEVYSPDDTPSGDDFNASDMLGAINDKPDDQMHRGAASALDAQEEIFNGIFGSGVLDRDETAARIEQIEEQAGATSDEAKATSHSVLAELDEMVDYPVEPYPEKDPAAVLDILQQIHDEIGG